MTDFNAAAVSGTTQNIYQEKTKSGPTIIGTTIAAGVGAGTGYGVYKLTGGIAESFAKDTLAISEDTFINTSLKDVEELYKKQSIAVDDAAINLTKTNAKKAFDESVKSANDILKKCKSLKIKYIAGFAAAATAIYVGCKLLFGKKEE